MVRFALLLALAACAPQDSGMAGCFDLQADGRYRYRLDSPRVDGMCPSVGELQRYEDAQAGVEPCGTACQLRTWAATLPMAAPRLPPAKPLPVPFGRGR